MKKENDNPTTLQVHLPTGSNGIRIVSIEGRVLKAHIIPRNRVKEFNKDRMAVYFLIGEDPISTKPSVYVGETTRSQGRTGEHLAKRTDWNTAIMFLTDDNSFSNEHALFFQYYCYQEIEKTKRYKLNNRNTPSKVELPEYKINTYIAEYFWQIKTILASQGFPLFETINFDSNEVSGSETVIYSIRGHKGLVAHGTYVTNGFAVKKGSLAVIEENESLYHTIVTIRRQLIEDKKLVLNEEGTFFVFTENIEFKSQGVAAQVVTAYSTNKWKEIPLSETETVTI